MIPLLSRFRLSLTGILVLALLTAGLGCTGKDKEVRKPVFPVKGQLFVNEKPAVGAVVLFTPVNEPAQPVDPRPRAEVDKDGNFTLTTYDANDGAPVGEYIVTITWEGGVLPDGREEPADKLGGRFSNSKTSKQRAKIIEGPNEVPAFRIK